MIIGEHNQITKCDKANLKDYTLYRYKLCIEYDGTNLSGLQRQKDALSVQQVLEEAIYKFCGYNATIFASGRTDAGVHALCQVVHFDLPYLKTDKEVCRALNFYVRPHKIAILSCTQVPSSFHARFSTTQREYLYIIINREGPLALMHNKAYHVRDPLDLSAMQKAALYLIGQHDFSSFRATCCQAKSPIKTLNSIEIHKINEEIRIIVKAASFLHHMVRNIVGTLVEVGKNKIEAADVQKILEAKDRKAAGPTAPACGLYFLNVRY